MRRRIGRFVEGFLKDIIRASGLQPMPRIDQGKIRDMKRKGCKKFLDALRETEDLFTPRNGNDED